MVGALALAIAVSLIWGCRSSAAIANSDDPQARLKSVSAALSMYLTDNSDTFPPFTDAAEVRKALQPYVRRESCFYSVQKGEDSSRPSEESFWEWNSALASANQSEIVYPARTLTFFDPVVRNDMRIIATADGQVSKVTDRDWVVILEESRRQPQAKRAEGPPGGKIGQGTSRPTWPRAWRFASQAFSLWGKRGAELSAVGEPASVHEVRRGAPWVEERFAGWLEGHNVFRWEQEGLHLNPTSPTHEPKATLLAGVDSSTKQIDYIQFSIESATGPYANDWDLSVEDLAVLLGESAQPVMTYWVEAPFGGFNLLTVFPYGNAYLAVSSSTDKLFESSKKTDFETGKESRSYRLAGGMSLAKLKARCVYLGPQKTKFNFNGVNQPDVNDLQRMPFRSVVVPRKGSAGESTDDARCKQNLARLRQYIAIQPRDSRSAVPSIAGAGVVPICPVGGESYTYNTQTLEVRCPHPGHEKF